MAIKRILVPVDRSAASLEGLEHAVSLAKQFKATLLLLCVVEPLYYAGDLGSLLEEQRRFAHEELSRLQTRVQKRGIRCRILMYTGTPHQVIGEIAQREKADLIVMATHGRSGVSRMMLGSVAERVVRTATACPVLTVRPRTGRRRH